jgi:spermidine synthase
LNTADPSRTVVAQGGWRSTALLGVVLVIATAGLIYELSLATVASYLLGDTVTQFSLVIGIYLSALGAGAYLSRFFEQRLTIAFVRIEFATALLGGTSAIGLELCFSFGAPLRVLLLMAVLAIGVLVGLELPLLMRILERQMSFRELIARALGFDYAGALIGSVGFSLLLLPTFGLAKTTTVCGLLNAGVGLVSTWLLFGSTPTEKHDLASLRWVGAIVVGLLATALAFSDSLVRLGEANRYGRVVTVRQSPYQRIVLVERQGSFDLFLNGRLQFAGADEHRYHEALVHPVLAATSLAQSVFVGGGGDGLAVREILKWPSVRAVTLVDIDPVMTQLAISDPRLSAMNRGSLLSPKVHVINDDAMTYLQRTAAKYDVILLDFPDPTQFALGKLYSTRFYASVRDHLAADGTLGVQCTSPLLTRQAFWSIVATLEAAKFRVIPYRVFVPSFGDWGFAVAKLEHFQYPALPRSIPLQTLDAGSFAALTDMPLDTRRLPAAPNHLDDQSLVSTYLREIARFD